MCVGHEADERALETSTKSAQQHETRFGKLHRALEIDDAQIHTQIPVRLEFEIERGRRAPTTHLGVIVFVFADRRGFGRNVRDREDELVERRLGLLVQIGVVGDLLFELRDLCFGCFCLFLLAFAHERSDALRNGVALRKQRFLLRDRAAAIFVELQEALRIPREIAAFHGLVHKIDVFADESDVEHDFPFVNNSSTQNFISASLVLLRYSD